MAKTKFLPPLDDWEEGWWCRILFPWESGGVTFTVELKGEYLGLTSESYKGEKHWWVVIDGHEELDLPVGPGSLKKMRDHMISTHLIQKMERIKCPKKHAR